MFRSRTLRGKWKTKDSRVGKSIGFADKADPFVLSLKYQKIFKIKSLNLGARWEVKSHFSNTVP